MLWILNEVFSQDWDGDLSSVLCVDADHPEYDRYNSKFIVEQGRAAGGGYVVLEYVVTESIRGIRRQSCNQLVIGFDNPCEMVYKSILDQIAFNNGACVIDIRGFDYVGIA